MTQPKYQLLDPLPQEAYDALKADIAERGMLYAILVDETGAVLDGHHRKRAAEELGIDCPANTLPGLSEEQKLDVSLAANLLGRKQTREEKRKTIRRYLLRRPDVSDRHAAQVTGSSHSTVAAVRSDLMANLAISGERVEESGRKARGRKPKAPDPEAVAKRQADLEAQRAKAAPKQAAKRAEQEAEEATWRASIEARGGALRSVSKPPARVVATQDRIKAALSDCTLALTRALQDPGLDEDLVNSELALPPEFRLNEVRKRLRSLVDEFGRRLAELEKAAKASRTERESPVREQ
jgi:ParB-like chromosome segregation protein Spo0J